MNIKRKRVYWGGSSMALMTPSWPGRLVILASHVVQIGLVIFDSLDLDRCGFACLGIGDCGHIAPQHAQLLISAQCLDLLDSDGGNGGVALLSAYLILSLAPGENQFSACGLPSDCALPTHIVIPQIANILRCTEFKGCGDFRGQFFGMPGTGPTTSIYNSALAM